MSYPPVRGYTGGGGGTGPQGSQGAQGAQGSAGSMGNQGAQGAQGPQGSSGGGGSSSILYNNLPSPVTLVHGTQTKIMESASLANGTWIVTFNMNLQTPATGNVTVEVTILSDSGTMTFGAVQSCGLQAPSTLSDDEIGMGFTTVVIVTSPGVVGWWAQVAGSVSAVALDVTANNNYVSATGYTALKVA